MQGLWWNDVLAGMTLRLYVKFALGLVLLLCTVDAEAQRDRSQSSKRQRKVQVQKKQERAKAENAAFKAGRKQHWKAQDGATRKRWRKQRRAARRMRNGGGPDAWYKGIFQSKHPIPWPKRAANKVGNLFKRKRNRRSY